MAVLPPGQAFRSLLLMGKPAFLQYHLVRISEATLLSQEVTRANTTSRSPNNSIPVATPSHTEKSTDSASSPRVHVAYQLALQTEHW